jgi:probable DNA metabolism protein
MQAENDSLTVMLEAPDDFAGFRQAARVLLALGAAPEVVHWRWTDELSTQAKDGDLFADAGAAHAAAAGAWVADAPARVITPDALDRLTIAPGQPVHIRKPQLAVLRHACCHRNPGRFMLCYRWLWRLQCMPSLAGDALDADWREIERLARAVGREIHKMHAFVRFRPAQDEKGAPLHVAWFEPEHHIVRAASGFFRERFSNMRWAILTPGCSVLWDQECLQCGATQAQAPGPGAGEALWLAYYQSTFNPARLKEQAMLREMPRRYWKNLPETQLISGLVAGARSRTGLMLAAQPAAQRA